MPSTLITWMLLLLDSTATIPHVPLAFEGTLVGSAGLSSPMRGFAEVWGREMFTFGGHIAFPLGRTPLQAGFEFSYGVMDTRTSNITTHNENDDVMKGTLTTRCKILGYHPLLRLSPLKGKVRPYADGLIGVRQFITTSTVTADGVHGNISKDRELMDLALSKGWAAGIMFSIGDAGVIDLRAEGFDSGKATYVDPNSIEVSEDGVVSFNTLTSDTDVINLLLGIGLRF